MNEVGAHRVERKLRKEPKKEQRELVLSSHRRQVYISL